MQHEQQTDEIAQHEPQEHIESVSVTTKNSSPLSKDDENIDSENEESYQFVSAQELTDGTPRNRYMLLFCH